MPAQIKTLTHEILVGVARATHQLEGGAVEVRGPPTNWREGLWRAHQLEGGAVEV